jgi:hypothetical protein
LLQAGISIQLLNLSWSIFYIHFLFLSFVILFYSIHRIKKKKIRLFNDGLYNFIKQYWFLVWMNNYLDDGYYLNRITTLSYIDQPFAGLLGTGVLGNVTFNNSYNYNVFELEVAVYIYISWI